MPCLLLRDERDLAGKKGKLTIGAMAPKARAAAKTVHSGAEQKLKTSFEPLPKEARLTAIGRSDSPDPPDPPPSGVLGKTPHPRGFVFWMNSPDRSLVVWSSWDAWAWADLEVPE